MNAIQKFIEAEHKYLDLNEIDYKEYERTVEPLWDVECVVRCKDCRFAHLTYDGMCKQCEQIMDDEDNMITLYFPGDHYCAYGERKGGDGDG